MAREIMMFVALLLSTLRVAWGPEPQHKPQVLQAAYHSHESSSKESEYPMAMGKRLTIDLSTGGSIDITGWDKETVSVTSDFDDESCPPEFDNGPNGLNISQDCDDWGWKHHRTDDDNHLTLSVPRSVNLQISTAGGAVSIKNVEGKIDGETMGGDLDLSGLKGEIDLKTMGGDITLTDSHLDGSLETMGGQVLFQDVVGGVKGTSMGGNVQYKNVRRSSEDAPSKEVRISTMGGEINVDSAPAGADLHTMGGDIHVGSAVDHVKCETMGGNIDLDSVDGAIHATTMGGDVTAKMVGDPNKGNRDVLIDSKGGDVELVVPAGLSIDFDVQLAHTRDCHCDVRIQSDFPIQQEESDNWESNHGSPRKYIYGTGKVGDGKNKVTIRTINGDIIIRKG